MELGILCEPRSKIKMQKDQKHMQKQYTYYTHVIKRFQ